MSRVALGWAGLSRVEPGCAGLSRASVTMHSVWPLPNLWMCSTAAGSDGTSSTAACSAPYSKCRSAARGSPSAAAARGPPGGRWGSEPARGGEPEPLAEVMGMDTAAFARVCREKVRDKMGVPMKEATQIVSGAYDVFAKSIRGEWDANAKRRFYTACVEGRINRATHELQ